MLWLDGSVPGTLHAQIAAVAMDMEADFAAVPRQMAPLVQIVRDKFHVSKHLFDEAADKVRREKHRRLLAAGDERLSDTKFLC